MNNEVVEALPDPIAVLIMRSEMTPDANAFISFQVEGVLKRVTWRDLNRQVAWVSQTLHEAGVKRGDRVGGLLDLGSEWVVIFLAALKIGAITSFIEPFRSPKRIAQWFVQCRPRFIYVSAGEQLVKFRSIQNQLNHPHELVIVNSFKDFESPHDRRASIRPDNRIGGFEPRGCLSEWSQCSADTAAICYTSGTTRAALPVALSFRGLVTPFSSWKNFGQASSIVTLCTTSPGTISGITIVLRAIFSGFSVAFTDTNLLAAKLQILRPHVIVSVPVVFRDLVKSYNDEVNKIIRFSVYLGGRVAYCTSLGAPIPSPTLKFYSIHNVPLHNAYGMCEAGGIVCPNLVYRDQKSPSGRVQPWFSVKLGEDGEIFLRGKMIMNGYWEDEQSTRSVLTNDGWLASGDIGRLEGDGSLQLKGRKKETFLNCNSQNISIAEIEALISVDPFIDQVCLYGDGRDFLTAVVVPNCQHVCKWASEWTRHFQFDELLNLEITRQKILERISCHTGALDAIEHVKDVVLTSESFTTENGLLTDLLKTRREAVAIRYLDKLEALYEAHEHENI